MDYPNSKKAKKVFLCLFVGGGGAQQQVPKGLDGEEVEDGKARFEKRRERERSKEKGGKRKSIKDRDWIIKKKEVSLIFNQVLNIAHADLSLLQPALPQARQRKRPERFEIHRSQAESRLLMPLQSCITIILSVLLYWIYVGVFLGSKTHRAVGRFFMPTQSTPQSTLQVFTNSLLEW